MRECSIVLNINHPQNPFMTRLQGWRWWLRQENAARPAREQLATTCHLVDSHPHRNGGADDVKTTLRSAFLPRLLHSPPVRIAHTRVVKPHADARCLELRGDLLRLVAGEAVHNSTRATAVAMNQKEQLL